MVREGKRLRATHLEGRVIASLRSHSRVGFIVPRHGRTAVDRNRLKRRLREIVRTRLLPETLSEPPAVDLVIRTRPSAYGAPMPVLADDVRRLGRQIRQLS